MENKQDSNSIFSFGVIADLQYCDAETFKNRHFRNSLSKLKIAIEEFNKHHLNFVINMGDIIDGDWQSFDEILPLLNQSIAPVYHVLGNHDYEVNDIYKSEIHHKLSMKKYYDFSINNWRLIVLDGNDVSTFANIKDTDNHQQAKAWLIKMEENGMVNANFWNGGIGKDQVQWLQQTLESAQSNGQKSIIFCHFPLFPSHRHNLLNDLEILYIFKKYETLKICFSGHNHDGNYGQFNDIHFVNVKGMVETAMDYAFCKVDIFNDCINIVGYGTEISAKLSI